MSPPTKRLRGLKQEAAVAVLEDPFGDEPDFTQDDLDEIDVIASQAVSAAAVPPQGRSPLPQGRASRGKNTANRRPLSNGSNSYGQLEAQHAELKKKLKEVEEEILMKSGEIQVLRDSLRATQQEKEEQRQKQLLLDAQKDREHSEHRKDLNKKVQSLQSELQFKEAEINQMKTKLMSSDRSSRMMVPRDSPQVLSVRAQLHHGSSSGSSSPTGNGFITKETFAAESPVGAAPVKTRTDGVSSRTADRNETTRPDPFLHVRPQQLQHRGGVLLGLLLQQPLSPSRLCLSHLLTADADVHGSRGTPAGVPLHAGVPSAGGASGASLSPVQILAVNGLNLLSQTRVGSRSGSCPGAVLLLPLLDLLLSRILLCQDLDSAGRPVEGGPGSVAGLMEESFLQLVDSGLAALRILYLLLTHSDEVVEAVLSEERQRRCPEKSAAGVEPHSHHALLQSVVRLGDVRLCTDGGSQREVLVCSAMKTLCVLLEKSQGTQANRVHSVLDSHMFCVSASSTVRTVSQCVSVIRSMTDHQVFSDTLCSSHDSCVFLKLFDYIRTRPDEKASNMDWTLLDFQTVRLLSRLTQRAEIWNSLMHAGCRCDTELVQTVVIVSHRQWLDLRGVQDPSDSTDGLLRSSSCSPAPPSGCCWGAAASLLRESILLLHWLLLHHSSFSESCRPLLHMYDQMIPAVRHTLKRIPELSDGEELAVEEICRSDGDDADDMDIDTGT